MSSITRRTTAVRPAGQGAFRILRLALLPLAAIVTLYVLGSLAYVHWHEREAPRDTAPPGGRFIDVAGTSVYAQSHGDTNAAMPVLLVHGTAAWSGTWFSLIPALQRAGHPVIAVDLPPFGYSDKTTTTDFSRIAQARRLVAVLDAHGVRRAIVVGHSFGGGPALELAMLAPDRVRQLVLVDAALGLQGATPDPSTPACRLLSVRPLRETLLAATASSPLWSKSLLRGFVARKEAVTHARLAQYRRPSALHGANAALGAWGWHFACAIDTGASMDAARIRHLSVPTVLIWGARDTVTPLAQARHLQQLLPNAPLHVIDSVGHIPHIEDPAHFEHTLLDVLDDGVADHQAGH